jgi:selenocysteine-specific elongation factor
VLDRPIAAALPDRYVVRDVSARRTIGGGSFIDLRPPTRRRRTPERQAQRAALAIADPLASFTALREVSPFAWDIAIFARDRALSAAQTDRLVKELDLILLDFRGHSETATERGRWVEWPDKV